MLLQALQLLHPQRAETASLGIRQSPWGQGDGAHLGPVGEAGALELLGEEAAVEVVQPLQDGGPVIGPAQGVLRQAEHLPGREAPADGVVQEEVMELIGATRSSVRWLIFPSMAGSSPGRRGCPGCRPARRTAWGPHCPCASEMKETRWRTRVLGMPRR